MPMPQALQPTTAPDKRWQIVVVGRWNPAILTPKGIARRLFGVSDSSPIEIEVSVDNFAPNRVRRNGITVSVDDRQLVVQAAENTVASLVEAAKIARNAVTDLPQTPFTVASHNAMFTAPKDNRALARLWTTECDERLRDSAHTISARTLSRTVRFGDGEATVVIGQKQDQPYDVIVAFHRASPDMPDLQKWLAFSVEEIEAETARLTQVFAEEARVTS